MPSLSVPSSVAGLLGVGTLTADHIDHIDSRTSNRLGNVSNPAECVADRVPKTSIMVIRDKIYGARSNETPLKSSPDPIQLIFTLMLLYGTILLLNLNDLRLYTHIWHFTIIWH